jgi:hypothetical protein
MMYDFQEMERAELAEYINSMYGLRSETGRTAIERAVDELGAGAFSDEALAIIAESMDAEEMRRANVALDAMP